MRERVAASLVVALALTAAPLASALDRAEERAQDFMALTQAAGGGDLALVKQLLSRGVEARHPPEGGTTEAQYFASLSDPVLAAAAGGHTEIVEALLSAGAEPDWMCCSGETALVMAAERGHSDTVRLLLENGADPLILGCAALTSAVTGHHLQTAIVLLPPTLFALLGTVGLAVLALVALALLWRSVRVGRAS